MGGKLERRDTVPGRGRDPLLGGEEEGTPFLMVEKKGLGCLCAAGVFLRGIMVRVYVHLSSILFLGMG